MTQKHSWEDVHAYYNERAAHRQFDGGEPRAVAEANAVSETYDWLLDEATGVVAELHRAQRTKALSSLAAVLSTEGLPIELGGDWGVGFAVFGIDTYRPRDPGEQGDTCIIVAIREHSTVFDLVGCRLRDRLQRTRLGVGEIVGESAIALAYETGQPLIIYSDVVAWLRADRAGVVVVDWRWIDNQFDGLRIVCDDSTAKHVRRIARNSLNPPRLVSLKGRRHVA
jgi:hypothetical protein